MPVATLRRNGKVPSCEPCRKSKLSCDHETPICGRCKRRKISDRCEYHPAPMTQIKSSDTNLANKRSWRDMSSVHSGSVDSSTTTNLNGGSETSEISTAYNRSTRESEGTASQYLGSTSYSAVFTEGQSHPQLQDLSDGGDEDVCIKCNPQLNLAQSRIQEGVEILALLPSLGDLERGLQRWFIVQCAATAFPFMENCIKLISQQKPESKASLFAQSEKVFNTTSKPLNMQSSTTFEDIPHLLMGHNLRWEMVGLMLTTGGLSAIAMDEVGLEPEDEMQSGTDWKAVATRMLQASDKCICFCDSVSQLNETGVWLIMMNYILHSQVHGDADHLCWRKLGDLTTAVYALGLHQESKDVSKTPLFLREIRRRVFWFSYICDKNFATFFGRPPMINSSYISVHPPLELDEQQLSLSGQSLQDELAKLDPDSWHKETKVGKASWLRVSIICCQFREEILALSLGPGSPPNLKERALDILKRQDEAYEALPSKMRDRPRLWLSNRTVAENFFSLTKYLDPLYNRFLLHRTLVKRLRVEPTDLIQVSRTMLSTILVLCGNRHRMGYYAADLPWLISLYGLPPAGVLGLELLQQSNLSTTHQTHLPDSIFPRSEIIQNLSILISSIGCIVRPTNGNCSICGQAKKMLQVILDTVLTHPLQQQTVLPASSSFSEQQQEQQQQMQTFNAAPTNPVPASGSAATQRSNGANRVSDINGGNEEENHQQQQQSQASDMGLETNAYMWFDDLNFDMDFWNSLEDHPLLSWSETTLN